MNIQPLEPIDIINQRLVDYFGRFENGQANWKLVWSEDFIEKKLMTHTDAGIELIHPEVREVRKASYIRHKYVLVQLTPIPEENQGELLGEKLSYEPVWTFEDVLGNAIQPKWEFIQVLIQSIYNQLANAGHNAPYKIPENQLNTAEAIQHRIDVIVESLYGNESTITDSLKNDSAVGYGTRKRNDWLH